MMTKFPVSVSVVDIYSSLPCDDMLVGSNIIRGNLFCKLQVIEVVIQNIENIFLLT